MARKIPNPNSLLSSKRELAQAGPYPSFVTTQGKEGTDPPQIEDTSVIKGLAPKEIAPPDAWKRDPFIILEKDLADLERKFSAKGQKAKKPELSQLILTGIIYSEKNPSESYAMISGELLRAGDKFLGFKIHKILPNSVIIKWENQEFILELWQEQDK